MHNIRSEEAQYTGKIEKVQTDRIENEKFQTDTIEKPQFQPHKKLPQHKSFFDVEMMIDPSAFEGSTLDIKPGVFVSFRYTAWIGSAPPLNPKISLQ
jgi:hypothetical protein